MTAAIDEDGIAPPTLLALFFACGRIGMLSFGGSVSAMMHVDFVTSRRWVSEGDFLEGLAIAQALPGVNVTNLSIWLGYRLRGPVGAIVACLGSILPPAILIVIAGALLQRIEDIPTAMLLLAGLGAAALGMSMTMGLRSARHALTNPRAVLVFLVVTGGVFYHIPTALLVGIAAPVSIALAFWNIRNGQE
jgi:chromate transporter